MNWISYCDRPEVVVWEMTRACRLACTHCRAEAQPKRDPLELDTNEARTLIDHVADIAPRFFIFSGGDPSRRPDLVELVAHAASRGLRVALSPSATPDMLALDFEALAEAGLACLSFSLDGATEETHNAFRGVKRAWEWTMQGIEATRKAGIPFQINTTITAQNYDEFDAMAALVESLKPSVWSIFMVVPTGRADVYQLPEPKQAEALLNKLCELSRRVPFAIKTTEAPQYRRIQLQQAERAGLERPHVGGTNDGRGFVFVSHRGEVCPSGFLPVSAGNVRRLPLLQIYRESPLFRSLRNPTALKGKCGRCDYRTLCGGSRARAFALRGDPLAEEPLCTYQPKPQE